MSLSIKTILGTIVLGFVLVFFVPVFSEYAHVRAQEFDDDRCPNGEFPPCPGEGDRPGLKKNPQTGIVCGDDSVNIPGCVPNTVSYTKVKDTLLPTFSAFQVGFIGLIAVVILTVAGLFLVTSLGDPAKKKKALEMAYNAIIAIVIAMLAYILVQLVLGLDFQNPDASGWVPHAVAQETRNMIPDPPAGNGLNIPPGNPNQNLGYFIQGGLNVLFYIAGPIVILMFIMLGIRMVQAEGKEDESKKVWKGIGYAALGLSFMGLAYALVRIILSIRL